MVEHFRIRQTQPKPIFTYILPLEIPLQNPLKGPLNFFFQKFKKISFLALLPYYKTTLVITIMKVITKKPLSSRILKLPQQGKPKNGYFGHFQADFDMSNMLKRCFQAKNSFFHPRTSISSIKTQQGINFHLPLMSWTTVHCSIFKLCCAN